MGYVMRAWLSWVKIVRQPPICHASQQPASPMSRPQPPAQLYMHIILFFTIKYLISRLPPNWSPRLVCLLGSVIKWRESECNDNCVQDPQHCSYAASKIQFPLGTIQVFHHHKSTTHWSKMSLRWI